MNYKKRILIVVLVILISITAVSFSGCSSRKTLGDFTCDELAEKYEDALAKVLNFYGEDFDSVDVVYAESLSDNIDGVNYAIYIDNKISNSYLTFLYLEDRYDIPSNVAIASTIQDADAKTFLFCNAALLAMFYPDDSIYDLYDFYVELYEEASDTYDVSVDQSEVAYNAYNEDPDITFACSIDITSYIPPTLTIYFFAVQNEEYGL